VADATLQILGLGTSAVPLDYNVSGPQTLDLIAVKGTFDGSTAVVDFVAVVEILSPAGEVMATSTSPTITAGSSASVTFAPFLRSASTQTAGGGIKFDTEPQNGGYLYTQVSSSDPTFGFGYVFDDVNENGSLFTGPLFVDDQSAGAATARIGSGFGHRFNLGSSGQSFFVNGAATIAQFETSSGTDQLAFFGVAPVVRQATPVTLADVIALLQAYGLSA
jgi:hypothetical protein